MLSLAPYEQQIKEIYGVGVDEIVEGANQIHEYQKTGVLGRYEEFRSANIALMERLAKSGYDVSSDAPESEVERIRSALTSAEFKR